MPAKLLVAAFAALAFATPAHASVAHEQHRAVWIAGDDRSGPRRLATGYEPHLTPGGATVVYRDRSGMRLDAVPAAGGTRRHLLTLHVPRAQRFSWRIAPLGLDFSSDGRRALVPLAGHTAALVDVATGRSRTRHRLDQPDLSPDGREVVWVRDRGGRCDVAVRSLASSRTRSLRRLPCAAEVTWHGRQIALLS